MKTQKLLIFLFVLLGVLIASGVAHAGGPKTPIVAQSDGTVLSATINVSLCGASSPLPCYGQTFACPVVNIYGPNLIVKTNCGPAGFKVTNYAYSISAAGGCAGVALSGDTIVCGGISLKVGH